MELAPDAHAADTPCGVMGDEVCGSGLPRRFVLAVTVVFSLACAVPYLWAWSATPADARFTGILLNPFDQNYYQGAQRSAAQDLAQRNRFTTEPGAPGPVAPLYPLTGELQQMTGMPAMIAYHLPRILAVVALPAVITWLFSLCFPARRQVIGWSVALALFSSGIGTFAPWLPQSGRSSEWVAESNILRSMSVYPHFSLAHVGLALSYGAALMALRGGSVRRVAAVGLAGGILLSLSHTFLVLPVSIVLGIVAGVVFVKEARERAGFHITVRLVAAAALVAPALPVMWSLRGELASLEKANQMPFPAMVAGSWWTWIYAFGLLVPLAIAGAVVLIRRRPTAGVRLLALWLAVHLLLVFSSVTPFQRRYIEGVAIPLGGLASIGLCRLDQVLSRRRLVQVLAAAVLIGGAMVSLRLLGASGQYNSLDYIELWELVDEHDVVLAGHELGSRLPAYAAGSVFLARPVETLRAQEKRLQRRQYALDPTGEASLRWLRKENITMVVVEKGDTTFAPRGLAQASPSDSCLQPVLETTTLRAYRISGPCIDSSLAI